MAAPAASHIPFVERCSYPLRAGNAVRALVDGEPAFRRICAAIEAARRSVWATIAFITPDFRMPDGRGDLFDVLDRAVARGLDVRVVFWRPNPETRQFEPRTFWGSPDHRRALAERGSRFRIRWDRAHGIYCQHQKSWIIDAGETTEVAFIGGINLNPRSVVAPGHFGEHHHHDAYVELAGPSASDVHHNFVQRWNEASERDLDGGTWGHDGDDDLAAPSELSARRGDSQVQVQRTLRAGRYTNGGPHALGLEFDVAAGEISIFDQYRLAIGAARRTIYIENQAVEVPEIVAELTAALDRGVEVVLLMPAEPEPDQAPASPQRQAFLAARSALGAYDSFTLAGIAGLDANGQRQNVYVHAKLMLIDDEWATIGSGNLHAYSLFGSTEMNASIWDPAFVRALRCELFAEHLGLETSHLDDLAALRLYRRIAGENRGKREAGESDWQGLAFGLDPATWRCSVETARPIGTTGYGKVAPALLATRLRFEEVHRHILHLVPDHPARILDVGSGPGHDAATLALRGHSVIAVEPTPELREGARAIYPNLRIDWLDDNLPRLERLMATHPLPFDFILVEGVWAHLTDVERAEAFTALAALLSEGGVLAISLRHGRAAPGRITHPVTAGETIALAQASGLATLVHVETDSIQAMNVASGVTWTRLAFGRGA